MAHELEIKNGKASMMYVDTEGLPWHKLGTPVKRGLTSLEALRAAGLDWPVAKAKMQASTVKLDNGTEVIIPAETQMVYRTTDGRRLGECGPKWTPVQNEHAFSWFDPFLEKEEAFIDTAGSLFDGRRVWILAKLNREDTIIVPQADDRISKYILLSNNHDGLRSLRIGFTPIRVVCRNTEAAAIFSAASKLLRLRHNKNILANMETVRDVMNLANQEFEATAEQYRLLAKRQVNETDLKKLIKIIFKETEKKPDSIPPAADEAKKKRREAKEDDGRKMENKIIPLFENGRGANLPGVKGTLWAAYNAVTEFFTWNRGRTTDARLDSLWFGQSAEQSKRALDVFTQFAAGKVSL